MLSVNTKICSCEGYTFMVIKKYKYSFKIYNEIF